MDGKRFDDLSKVLGTAVSRQSVFQLLAGIGASGLAAITGANLADAKQGKGKGKGKGGHNKGKNDHDNNDNKGKANSSGGAQAEGKRKKGKGKNKKKGNNKRTDNVQASSDKLCPGNQDKICHCPPGNPINCQTVGNGGGHEDHPDDCCCTINGVPNPDCECPGGGTFCCKPIGTSCEFSIQCCDGAFCCNGKCQEDECCTENGDSCDVGDDCCSGNCCDNTCQEDECCTPKTCADFPGECGDFSDGCGGEITCACDQGEDCCKGICITDAQCCSADECEQKVCQIRDCVEHECDYTPVGDGQQGPLCNEGDEFCCKLKCCEGGQVCTDNGCCTPKTCARDYPGECGERSDGCGGTLHCECGAGEGCCGGQCIEGDQCCESDDCKPLICQVPDCVDHECNYTPVPNGQQGPLCTDSGDFCCNGDECCEAGDVCLAETGCCTPKTCADFPGQCGDDFSDGCGGKLTCGCDQGEDCCGGVCITEEQCCAVEECAQRLCQNRACVDHECNYTPVDNGDPGPECTDTGEFCCNGDECCVAGQVCTEETGCCTPKTCADFEGQCGEFSDDCGGTLTCSCAEGEDCCGGVCITEEQCCAVEECAQRLCQNRACVDHECNYTPVDDGEQGPLCTDPGDFCCNAEQCCEAGQVCTENGCCTKKTCADFAGQCGVFPDSCGGELSCSCADGQGCCNGQCVEGEQCCVDDDCDLVLCQVADCDQGDCEYTPVENGEQGPLCTDDGDFCCNGNQCCVTGDLCLAGTGCCTPETKEEACAAAGRVCGEVSDGCGGTYDCGACSATQTCIAGVCLAKGGKRCKGKGLAGQPCKGKKCKCKAGRRCNKGKCCEPVGDGSRHCNADSDCCPGLSCIRKYPDQHKVCMRKGAKSASVSSTSAPSLALGAIVTGLLAKGASRFFGSASSDATVALNDLSDHVDQQEV